MSGNVSAYMNEGCSYNDSRAEEFGDEECPRWHTDATMTFSKDGEDGAYRKACVSVRPRGGKEVSRSRTKHGPDQNDKDGRDPHSHPPIIVIFGGAGRWRWI